MGWVHVLQWLRGQGCSWDRSTLDLAERAGHLEVLKWARENGCKEWSAFTCAEAAFGGHLEVLKWLREQGCPWDYKLFHEAARGGHKHIIQWAKANGAPRLNFTGQIFLGARESGDIGLADWVLAEELDDTRYPHVIEDACADAAGSGRLPLLQFLVAKDQSRFTGKACMEAVKEAQIEVLTWANESGVRPWNQERSDWHGMNQCSWEQSACRVAEDRGHIQILQWLKDNCDCQWKSWPCGRGTLEGVKWLREQGCPWHPNTCIMAAEYGNVEVLKWAM